MSEFSAVLLLNDVPLLYIPHFAFHSFIDPLVGGLPEGVEGAGGGRKREKIRTTIIA